MGKTTWQGRSLQMPPRSEASYHCVVSTVQYTQSTVTIKHRNADRRNIRVQTKFILSANRIRSLVYHSLEGMYVRIQTTFFSDFYVLCLFLSKCPTPMQRGKSNWRHFPTRPDLPRSG